MASSQQEPAATLTQAMQAHQQGELEHADNLYSAVLETDPANSQALRLQGILARETGDLQRSLSLLRRAHESNPESTMPLNELALSQMFAGDYAAAESALADALELRPDDDTALTNLGALMQHRGHIRRSIDCYQTLLRRQPNDIQVRCNLAKAFVDAGQFDAAIEQCNQAIEVSGSHPYALATKGAVLTDLERYAEALPLLQSATTDMPDDDMALVNLALCLDASQDYTAAATALQQALDVNAYNARAVSDLANILLKLDEVAAAVRLCEGFLAANPGECLVVASYALALAAAGEPERAGQFTDYSTLVKRYRMNRESKQTNGTLAELLRSDPSLLSDPISKSTTGGSQTGELDFSATDELRQLQHFIDDCIGESVEAYRAAGLDTHPVMSRASDTWNLRAWGTVLDSGGHQAAHMHPLGWLSGVYYVQIPAGMQNSDEHAGALLFGPAPSRFQQQEVESSYHDPVEGELVLFPSWLWHQTVPFSAGRRRISIAFDVIPGDALRRL